MVSWHLVAAGGKHIPSVLSLTVLLWLHVLWICKKQIQIMCLSWVFYSSLWHTTFPGLGSKINQIAVCRTDRGRDTCTTAKLTFVIGGRKTHLISTCFFGYEQISQFFSRRWLNEWKREAEFACSNISATRKKTPNSNQATTHIRIVEAWSKMLFVYR